MIKVKSARDLGLQFTDNPHNMMGQDGAYSIDLGRGEALWFFGDTLVGKRVPGESLWFPGGKPLGPEDMSGHGSVERLYTNTALILRESSGCMGLRDYFYICDAEGNLRQLVPFEGTEREDNIRVWCFHGCEVNDKMYLFYQTVRMTTEGPMPVNFELIGSGLAVGSRRDWIFRRISANNSTILWPAPLPQFSCAVVPRIDEGFIYLYGVAKDDEGMQRCYLARVAPENMEKINTYEYLTSGKPTWGPDPGRCVSIMAGMPNEMSVSWNAHLNCWLAVHSLDLSGKIVAHTAPELWGPWSKPVELWQIVPPKLNYKIPYAPLMYAAKEHPELSEENGRVLYITYVEFEEYFPHLVEVELE
jgi:hypothetical protein